MPTWTEPMEWLGAPLAERFPLHLLSTQPATRLHGQMDMGRVSQESKISGREPMRSGMEPRVLGPNEYLMMGDNRNNSNDGRSWGPLTRDRVIGRAEVLFWPIRRFHVFNWWLLTFLAVLFGGWNLLQGLRQRWVEGQARRAAESRDPASHPAEPVSPSAAMAPAWRFTLVP